MRVYQKVEGMLIDACVFIVIASLRIILIARFCIILVVISQTTNIVRQLIMFSILNLNHSFKY